MIRVLIVDDQQLLRRGLKLLLAQSPEIQVVTTCASAAETLVSLHNSEVDVVLADAVMPGMDGPELVEQCRTLWPSLPVIILTTFDDATIVRRSIKASPTTLAEAITAAYDGHPYVDPRVAHLLALPSRFAGLTPTEKTVAELVGQGLSNREIAAELHLAEGTVKNHISALLRKTQVPDRTRLALHFHT